MPNVAEGSGSWAWRKAKGFKIWLDMLSDIYTWDLSSEFPFFFFFGVLGIKCEATPSLSVLRGNSVYRESEYTGTTVTAGADAPCSNPLEFARRWQCSVPALSNCTRACRVRQVWPMWSRNWDFNFTGSYLVGIYIATCGELPSSWRVQLSFLLGNKACTPEIS